MRVSNELGAGRPKAAKFSVIVVVVTSLSIGLIFLAIILTTKNDFAVLFTSSKVVMERVSNMAMLLGITMVLNSVQQVLLGRVCILIHTRFTWMWLWKLISL